MRFILAVLGTVLIIEGIPYFGFPGKAREWSARMQEVPDATLRGLGLATMLSGLLLLFLLRYL